MTQTLQGIPDHEFRHSISIRRKCTCYNPIRQCKGMPPSSSYSRRSRSWASYSLYLRLSYSMRLGSWEELEGTGGYRGPGRAVVRRQWGGGSFWVQSIYGLFRIHRWLSRTIWQMSCFQDTLVKESMCLLHIDTLTNWLPRLARFKI